MRELKLGLFLLLLVMGASGCFLPFGLSDGGSGRANGSGDPVVPTTASYAITLDWDGKGAGAQLAPGMDLRLAWESAPAGSLVRLEIFRNNAQYEATLLNYAPDTGTQTWTIPLDIVLHDADQFQAKLTIVDALVQTRIIEERYSPPFKIVRAGNNAGLSDVTVNAKSISITLTDDGSLVDGDRVDVFLNGVKEIDNHTLVGGAGTVFSLELLSGSNELRVTALNEGTSSPNTAQLAISNVTAGEALQSWRLLTGESGSLDDLLHSTLTRHTAPGQSCGDCGCRPCGRTGPFTPVPERSTGVWNKSPQCFRRERRRNTKGSSWTWRTSTDITIGPIHRSTSFPSRQATRTGRRPNRSLSAPRCGGIGAVPSCRAGHDGSGREPGAGRWNNRTAPDDEVRLHVLFPFAKRSSRAGSKFG